MACEAAVRDMDHTPTLLALRPKIVALLPKMPAYTAALRSLRFPGCAREMQRQPVGMLHENEAISLARSR